MKFFKFLAIVLTLAIVLPAGAQITIERADIPNIEGNVMPFYAVHFEADQEVEIDPGQAGGGNTWDFTQYMYPRIDNDDLIAPNGVAHFNAFDNPVPNRAMRSTDSGLGMDIDAGTRYEFIDDNGYDLLGIEMDPDQELGIPGMDYIEFDTPVQLLPFPANFEDAWDINTTFTHRVVDEENYPMFSHIDIVFTFENSTAEIDAWGDIIIPAGKFAALRVYTVGEGTIVATGTRADNQEQVEVDRQDIPLRRTYRWFAAGHGEIASVTSRENEGTRNFTLASKIRTRFIESTHYTGFERTASIHKLIINDMDFDGVRFVDGWEIGAYKNGGREVNEFGEVISEGDAVLAGAGVWRFTGDNDNDYDADKIGFPMYGGDPAFVDGDDLYFYFYNPNAQTEHESSIDVVSGPSVWTAGATTVINIHEFRAPVEQRFDLAGWKIISLNSKPDDFFRTGTNDGDLPRLDIENMIVKFGYRNVDVDGDLTFSSKVNLLKTEDGFFAFPNFTKQEIGDSRDALIALITAAYPIVDDESFSQDVRDADAATRDGYLDLLANATHYYGGFNNISYWDLAEGQQVNILNGVSADPTWFGTSIEYNHDIVIARGYNIIPYYPTYNLPCGYNRNNSDLLNFYAINDIEDDVFFIKNDEGKFAAPRFSFSNLTELIPTQGYKIYVDNDVTLNYPVAYQEFAPEDNGDPFVDNFEAPVLSSENMLVLVQDITGVNGDLKIAAYNSSNKIVGFGQINSDGQCGMAVWGDDPSTTEVEGLKDGEQFELRISDLVIRDGLVYKQDDFIVLSASENTEVPESYSLSSAFPNPFNSTTKISYGLPQAEQITISLYNITGQEVMTVFEGKQQAGFHSSTVVADGLTSGLYFLRLEASNQMFTQKVMLVK